MKIRIFTPRAEKNLIRPAPRTDPAAALSPFEWLRVSVRMIHRSLQRRAVALAA
ncbi:hypothetical protein [Massilia sp. PWRC2]|uniref:hypothetical protein n=1 Tax=Massilia sp. PWRC2 TaxID=2804626 RepID=UPI003CF6A6DF